MWRAYLVLNILTLFHVTAARLVLIFKRAELHGVLMAIIISVNNAPPETDRRVALHRVRATRRINKDRKRSSSIRDKHYAINGLRVNVRP